MDKHWIAKIQQAKNDLPKLRNIYEEISAQETQQWKEIACNHITNWTQKWEEIVAKYFDHTVAIEVDTKTEISYGQLDQKANRIANFINENIDNSHIGLYEKNSINFFAAIIGIGKARRLAILFNIREPENRIIQLAKNCQVKWCFGKQIKGVQCFDIDEVLQQEPISISSTLPNSQSHANIEDPAFVIFTSGTSGPSKPALFSHKRMLGAGMAWSIRTGMTSTDRCYITLPLCHGNALAVAFSSVVYSGGTAILREKLSVSHFWEDIRNFDCTNMVYIGELWRYLINVPEQPNDSQNPLEVIFGNGLKTDIWRNTLERFNILHVVEHFGATEMPAGALTNWTGRPGFCGFIPSGYTNEQEIVLLDENNREVSYNCPGQAVFHIPNRKYRGYLHPELDKDKLIHDLVKPGDLWWQSGDVLTRDNEGFFTFIERMGDSYRFKGENISSVDVENVLYKFDLIAAVCVYGIKLPWLDGQAGMATLRLKDENISLTLFLANLLNYLDNELVRHAIPHFIRINEAPLKTTSTLKILKKELSKEGIDKMSELTHFVLINGKYQILDEKTLNSLKDGSQHIG
ncbi:MAG: hypothetical protein BWK78_02880 [Thiotrichaceae bacterium IS1]|nr:MAG: hypothetical protein BWK78_02880 [Thiotrichaceae bacterium IS1]